MIKNLLQYLGMTYIWTHEKEIEIPYNAIKHRVFDTCMQLWYINTDINNSRRLTMYRIS